MTTTESESPEGRVVHCSIGPGLLAEDLGYKGMEVSHIALCADGRYSITLIETEDEDEEVRGG